MGKKVKLDLSQLQVDSFDPTAITPTGRGTLVGYGVTFIDDTCPGTFESCIADSNCGCTTFTCEEVCGGETATCQGTVTSGGVPTCDSFSCNLIYCGGDSASILCSRDPDVQC